MAEIDVVIPFGNGSLWGNNELRYCLRSIEKHLKGYRDIYIIGDFPDFINDKVKYIPYYENTYRTNNIKNKILQACNNSNVSRNFLCTNDDIYFVKDVNAFEYPYYYFSNFEDRIKERLNRNINNDTYLQSLNKTYNHLLKTELPTKYFDCHYPILYNKNAFKVVTNSVNWEKEYGYVIKSLYCNTMGINGIPIGDCTIKLGKYMDLLLMAYHVFSTDDEIDNDIKNKLEELFPEKSKYEL